MKRFRIFRAPSVNLVEGIGVRAPRKNFFSVGKNYLSAKPDGLTFAAGVNKSCYFHTRLQGCSAIAKSGQSTNIAVFDGPRNNLAAGILRIDENSNMGVTPGHLIDHAL